MVKNALFLFGCVGLIYNSCVLAMQKKDVAVSPKKIKFFNQSFASQRKKAFCGAISIEGDVKEVVKTIGHIIFATTSLEQHNQGLPYTNRISSCNRKSSFDIPGDCLFRDNIKRLSLIDSNPRHVQSEPASMTSSGSASPVGGMGFYDKLIRDFAK